jgi:hypothetical protein
VGRIPGVGIDLAEIPVLGIDVDRGPWVVGQIPGVGMVGGHIVGGHVIVRGIDVGRGP